MLEPDGQRAQARITACTIYEGCHVPAATRFLHRPGLSMLRCCKQMSAPNHSRRGPGRLACPLAEGIHPGIGDRWLSSSLRTATCVWRPHGVEDSPGQKQKMGSESDHLVDVLSATLCRLRSPTTTKPINNRATTPTVPENTKCSARGFHLQVSEVVCSISFAAGSPPQARESALA